MSQFQPSAAVWDAIELAARAHRGQVRKSSGVPYLVHPLGVARLLIEHGLPEEVVLAGVLHDTVEDTPVTLTELEAQFGARVASLVAALSKPDKAAPWEERKRHTLEALRAAPREVVLASCADKLDNLRSLEADLVRLGEGLWGSFKRGRPQQAWYYGGLRDAFLARAPEHPLVRAYADLVPRVFPELWYNDVHAGDGAVNLRSIGIEHAGFTARDDVSEAESRASARLTAWICVRYGIPIDRQHIIGHGEVPDPHHPGRFGGASNHTDPGAHWDWPGYMALVRGFAGGAAPPPPPPSSGGGAGQPTLRQGDRGAAVVALQDLLRARGFDPGASDGVFGAGTAAAVRGFQSARGLGVDGVVGPQTWGALGTAAVAAPPPPPVSAPPVVATGPVLRLGARGADVVRLQDLLRARGFDPGASGGVFGARTETAVRRLQAARGLGVDGVVGPRTWAALG